MPGELLGEGGGPESQEHRMHPYLDPSVPHPILGSCPQHPQRIGKETEARAILFLPSNKQKIGERSSVYYPRSWH